MSKLKMILLPCASSCLTLLTMSQGMSVKAIGGITIDGDGNYVIDPDKINEGVAATTLGDFWNTALDVCKKLTVVVTSILTLCFIVVFLVNFFQLAANCTNPKKKVICQSAILWSFVGCALFGGSSVILGIAFGILR